jgi:hypothetical protein
MSVFLGIGIELPNLPTTSNSFLSLYKPIVVAYGLKSDPETLSFKDPETPVQVGFIE